MARSTDSNGLAASPSASAATLRTWGAPGPRTDAAIRRSVAGGSPWRSAESATASASSKGSDRRHWSSVCSRLVAMPQIVVGMEVATVQVDGSLQAAVTLRFVGTKRCGRSGGVLTSQPWCSAALVRLSTPDIACAVGPPRRRRATRIDLVKRSRSLRRATLDRCRRAQHARGAPSGWRCHPAPQLRAPRTHLTLVADAALPHPVLHSAGECTVAVPFDNHSQHAENRSHAPSVLRRRSPAWR